MPRLKTIDEIPLTAKLLDVKDAAKELTDRIGRGYSPRSIWRRIESGRWEEGKQYKRIGGIVKVYIEGVLKGD
jgi:hypothetical protein